MDARPVSGKTPKKLKIRADLANCCRTPDPSARQSGASQAAGRADLVAPPLAFSSVLANANKPIKSAATYHQSGVYDAEILCEECERRFSEFDRYGWETLGPMALDRPPAESKIDHLYKIDCDTDKLRRFILSVLWRASVSKSPFYTAIKLGPYEDLLRCDSSTPVYCPGTNIRWP